MNDQVSFAVAGVVPARGFSKAMRLPSGENTRLRTVPRIVSRRAGSDQAAVAPARVALHTLRPSSEAHAVRFQSGDMTADAGGVVAGGDWMAQTAANVRAARTRVTRGP